MTTIDRLREAIEKYGAPEYENRVTINLDDIPRIASRAGISEEGPVQKSVFLVAESSYGGYAISGVYLTRGEAEDYRRKIGVRTYDVEELEVGNDPWAIEEGRRR